MEGYCVATYLAAFSFFFFEYFFKGFLDTGRVGRILNLASADAGNFASDSEQRTAECTARRCTFAVRASCFCLLLLEIHDSR